MAARVLGNAVVLRSVSRSKYGTDDNPLVSALVLLHPDKIQGRNVVHQPWLELAKDVAINQSGPQCTQGYVGQ